LEQTKPVIQAATQFSAFLKSFFEFLEIHLSVSQEKLNELNKSAKELFWWLKIQLAKLTKVIRQLKYAASLVRLELCHLAINDQLKTQTQKLADQVTELIAHASRVIQHTEVSGKHNNNNSNNLSATEVENLQDVLKHEIFTQPADEALAKACFDAVLQIDELVNKNPAN
jgi:ElaB/YqjD/DUF883 family membrane-anchored ribosome-binding protein